MDFRSGWTGVPDLTRRFLALSLVAGSVFLLLLLRLCYLQLIQGEHFATLSDRNRTRLLPVAATRGPIYDRSGQLLVDNRPAFDVGLLRRDVENPQELVGRLAGLLQVEPDSLLRRWTDGRRLPPYRTIPLAEDVPWELMEQVQEHASALPGVLVEVRPARFYPFGEQGAHLFGHLGEITEKELKNAPPGEYRSGMYIGKTGLERHLERYLRGREGERLVEVDVQGHELRQLRRQEPLPGNRVFLTLHAAVQRAAEEAFGDRAGAAVALDVRTGEVLAMVSRPAFSPELFARGIRGEEWRQLLADERHPLQFRAIAGQYPPGSTFKIVTALAALDAGVMAPGSTVNCTGSYQLGNREFRCWKKEGHGLTNLHKALRESCDTWFYQAGLALGIERLASTAFALGLGAPVGFPIEGEKGGLIPTKAWKRKQLRDNWYDGETLIAAIGQGYVLTTPLQLAVMTAAIANGGTVLRPQVIRRVEDWQGQTLMSLEPEVLSRASHSPAGLKAVQNALEAVVHEPGGTGWASRIAGLRVAGKTGTAQVIRKKEREKEADILRSEYRHRDHALFVAYAPAGDPEVAVAVVVEHGSHGATAAAPVARRMLEAYFDKQPAPPPVVMGETGD